MKLMFLLLGLAIFFAGKSYAFQEEYICFYTTIPLQFNKNICRTFLSQGTKPLICQTTSKSDSSLKQENAQALASTVSFTSGEGEAIPTHQMPKGDGSQSAVSTGSKVASRQPASNPGHTRTVPYSLRNRPAHRGNGQDGTPPPFKRTFGCDKCSFSANTSFSSITTKKLNTLHQTLLNPRC